MNKRKILNSLYLALFLLPEILWSPIGNFIYSFFMPTINGSSPVLRNNFLLNSDNELLFLIVLIIQFFGIAIFSMNYKKKYNKRLFDKAIFLICLLLSLVSLSVLVMAYSISHIGF